MEAHSSFPADSTSPRAARLFVAGVLGRPDDESTHLALVLTSELVTNSVLHACTPVDVRVEFDAAQVRVEVVDGDPTIPSPLPHAPDALGGRGLYLVEQLADTWGSDPCAEGKVVWFTLAMGEAPRRALRAV